MIVPLAQQHKLHLVYIKGPICTDHAIPQQGSQEGHKGKLKIRIEQREDKVSHQIEGSRR